jgi:aspartyl-tRNA(Asn)/glutamyl-tRNA(Gln) amidotransferase subunit A
MGVWDPIAQIADDVQSGAITASQNVKKSLDLINQNSKYKAIITTTETRAMARATEIDKRVAEGDKIGRLAGVPFIAKDNFLVFDGDTTAASNILIGFKAPYQSSVVDMLEAEGAICVAKANLDAFAHGGSTENSDFFTTKNPHDETRVPGGSSGGSAAAIMLDMAPFALGTDTGGSTRQPASFVGCVGYKPTYGLMSRSGIVAMASSTDTVGTFARNVDDAAIVIDVMARRDPLDGTTIERDSEGYLNLSADLKGLSVGVIKEYMAEGVDPAVKSVIQAALDKMVAKGVTLKEVSIPSIGMALSVYYILVPAEISSNLGRYDGQRYGYTDPEAKTLDQSYSQSRSIGFGKEAKRRIMIGTYVLSSGYYDAYYKKAQTVRTKLISEFNEVLKGVDVLAGPVVPTTAFKIGQNSADPLQMYLADILTVSANLTGIPAISIPAGMSEGLPVGLQLMAAQKQDRKLLEISKCTEEALK